MKEIPLTKGQIAKVDDEDYARLSAIPWHTLVQPNGMLYAHSRPFEMIDGKKVQRHVWMHREVLGVSGKVDHIDGDTLNNQKYNLRPCTQAQNNRNRKQVGKNNKTGFKGVLNRPGYKARPFLAQVRHGGKNIRLGCFSTAVEAAKAYNQAAPIYFGEFARLNVIPESHAG